MSKFLDEVKARVVGRTAVDERMNMLQVREDSQSGPYGSTQTLYRFEINLGYTFGAAPEHLEEARKNVIRSLRRVVYDEFVEKVMKIQRRAYHIGDRELIDLTAELLDEVAR